MASSHLQEPEVTDYAALMGIIYSMVKQDYVMQVNEQFNMYYHTFDMERNYSIIRDKVLEQFLFFFHYFCIGQWENITLLLQDNIVTSLNLKSSSGELESYYLMWFLWPYVNDQIMHLAWKLVCYKPKYISYI